MLTFSCLEHTAFVAQHKYSRDLEAVYANISLVSLTSSAYFPLHAHLTFLARDRDVHTLAFGS